MTPPIRKRKIVYTKSYTYLIKRRAKNKSSKKSNLNQEEGTVGIVVRLRASKNRRKRTQCASTLSAATAIMHIVRQPEKIMI